MSAVSSVQGPQITVLTGPVTGISTFYHVVTAPEIVAKGFSLPSIPLDLTQVFLNVVQGVQQYLPTDFSVDGAGFLSWNGAGLEPLLIAGDILVVSYQPSP